MSENTASELAPSELAEVVESASKSLLAMLKEMPPLQHEARISVRLGNASVELQIGSPHAATAAELSWPLLLSPRPKGERVAEAKRLLAENKVYPRGCSEFVCAVLGIPYELANALMGPAPPSLGKTPPYAALSPGDIAGWVSTAGSGHVAVYAGESAAVAFIDVGEPGARPRSKNAYYDREIFESSRF